jgi:hypothetical protein
MIFFFILFFIFIICCGVISTQFEILVILYRFGIFGGHHDFSMAEIACSLGPLPGIFV